MFMTLGWGDLHFAPASFSFAVVLRQDFSSGLCPPCGGSHFVPPVLNVLEEKGEVEGQCFLPCSLVVEEASLEETVNEQESSFPENTA